MSSAARALLTGAAIAAILPISASAGTARPPAGPKSGPARLWSEYPAGAERLRRATPPSETPTPERNQPRPLPARSVPDASHSPLLMIALLIAGSGVLALMAVAGVFVSRRARKRAAVAVIPDSASSNGAQRAHQIRAQVADLVAELGSAAPAISPRQLASAPQEWNRYPPTFPQGRSGYVSSQPEQQESQAGEMPEPAETQAAGAPSEKAAGTPDYADFGTRVAGILDAAEQTAEQIRTEARQDAATMRRELEEAAATRREQIEKEVEQLRADAETYAADIRKTGETYASQHRREAEEQAAKTLSDAEAQARATREAAEEMASRIETASRERQEKLQETTRTLEARLQRAVSGLREVTSQLDDVLSEKQEGNEETIVEALDARRPLHSA